MISLLAAALLLSACQVPIPYLAPIPNVGHTISEVDSETDSQSDVGAVSEESAPAETSESISEEAQDVTDAPMATIVASSLRIRSGPSVDYSVKGAAQAGEGFPLLGQAFGCQWLNVDHPTLGSVWLSGAPQYTSMNVTCDQVAAVEPPALATPLPAEETTEESVPAPAATPAVEAAAPPATPDQAAEESGLPSDLGCYLFQNFVGPELNVTVTAVDWEWNDNFRVPEGGERPYCFGPGRYTITIDAPPPWADLNGELNVHAGEHFLFPVEGRK